MFIAFFNWLFNRGRWSHTASTCIKCGGMVEQRGMELCYGCDWTDEDEINHGNAMDDIKK